jgi:rod shape determining protein RodA
MVVGVMIVAFIVLWSFVFEPYQKARVMNFVQPLSNIHGSGYNVYQATIAVGSGQIFGKGVGFGTQSRLNFLPEYETDFIFAAFSEEWGFVGVIILFILMALVIWRIMRIALLGTTNFEILYGLGLAIYFMTHFIINIGMNLGIMPVTGITLPFMSYGGSHLLTEFVGLGILMGMNRYCRVAHRDDMHNEFLGI